MAEITIKGKAKKKQMRPRKSAEKAFGKAFRLPQSDHSWLMKFGDAMYCRNCGSVVPKLDGQPDFIVIPGDFYYIEVKESDQRGYFRPFGSGGFTPVQRKRLAEHEGYIFLVMNDEEGSSAYYMAYEDWLGYEGMLETTEDKGFRRRSDKRLIGLDDIVRDDFKCQWIPGREKEEGHWQLPRLQRREPSWLTNPNP